MHYFNIINYDKCKMSLLNCINGIDNLLVLNIVTNNYCIMKLYKIMSCSWCHEYYFLLLKYTNVFQQKCSIFINLFPT